MDINNEVKSQNSMLDGMVMSCIILMRLASVHCMHISLSFVRGKHLLQQTTCLGQQLENLEI